MTDTAAALTYYGVLSIFPALIALISVVALVGDGATQPILDALADAPGPTSDILTDVVQTSARTGAGLHLKTAGTTWLEELIGLCEAGGPGLDLAREIYRYALDHVDEFCAPYASVIDIHRDKLPAADEVDGWSGPRLANALRHIPSHPEFNAHVRQLLHVSFKVAAKHGSRYLDLLKANKEVVGQNVTENIFERHMRPLFLG